MDDMQVYIANLGKYNEGELVGAWFTFPIDFEEVKEKIGLNDEYEEYAIHDYELPFTVDEYTSISELNRLWEMVSELPEELQSELSALLTHTNKIAHQLMVHIIDKISKSIFCFNGKTFHRKLLIVEKQLKTDKETVVHLIFANHGY
jgi:hypothetical protein